MSLKFPKPQHDKKQLEYLLEKGFEKYPKRRENFLKYKKSQKQIDIDYMPIKIDIEHVRKCNLSCHMCLISNFSSRKRNVELTFSEFESLLNQQYGVYELKLQGLGEPFLHKKFCEMVELACDRYMWVRSTTNATLLHLHENYRKIIDAGISELQISIDGVTRSTYEKIRINGDFDRVSQNCKKINDYCKSKNIDKTRMWVLLQRDNYGELDDFTTFARELGFKRLTISMDVNSWGNAKWDEKNSDKRVSARVTQEKLDGLMKEAKQMGMDLTFWDASGKYDREHLCAWPFERSYISADKRVVPCCLIADPDVINFGTADDFSGLWNSQKYREFRANHLEYQIPEVCKFCYAL